MRIPILLAVLACSGTALAADPAVTRGQELFARQGRDWSCATCHTKDPRNPGRHVKTQKLIEPMAPAVNPRRFSDPEKTEKWFRRNCKDVFARECTATEKADIVAYLRSLSKL